MSHPSSYYPLYIDTFVNTHAGIVTSFDEESGESLAERFVTALAVSDAKAGLPPKGLDKFGESLQRSGVDS